MGDLAADTTQGLTLLYAQMDSKASGKAGPVTPLQSF